MKWIWSVSSPDLKRAATVAILGAALFVGGAARAQQAAPQPPTAPPTQHVINPSYSGQQVTLAFGRDYGELRRQATISNINCPVVVSPVQLPGTMIGVRVGQERVVATDEAYAAHIANEMCATSGRS